MRASRRLAVIFSVAPLALGLVVTATAHAAAPPPQPHAVPAVGGVADQRVIVLMRDQHSDLPATTGTGAARAAAVAHDQSAAVASVHASGATGVKQFTVLNGFAATVSSGEAAALASDPDVASVLPDEAISEPSPATAADTAATPGPAVAPGSAAGLCAAGSDGRPQLNPQATVLTHSDSDVAGALTARSLGATGAGVKVGLIAEGIDTNNPDFVRADGSHVITDYQDFSGDGTAAPTDGAEMFLDATSVAAQGRKTYDVSHFSALPLDAPCKIRVEGVAPGASLVALKIFAQGDANTLSNVLQAIDYAVGTDHVDVMNESYGLIPFPDTDPDVVALDQLNDQIIRAGVTVVASSGDSGVTNAIWSPSSDPSLISVGATTAYRFDLQTGYAFSRGARATGWIDDNISSLSSGGVSQTGRTVDLVAPGELDFGVCTASATRYTGCVNYQGQPSNLEAIGGTSQSGPVVAGGAALVIQAYRAAHGGVSPTPAVVKQILTSTADDVDAPATQQGAGLLDSYKAVLLARSYPTGSPSPAASGSTLLASTNHLDVAAGPGTAYSRTVTLTNTGTRAQTVNASSRSLGADGLVASSTVTLSDSDSAHATDFQGRTDNVEKVVFTVPDGLDRLDARVAWKGASSDLAARVRLTLIDPSHRLAGYSLPQGIGNYGDSQVAHPLAGVWTAYVTSRESGGGGSTGPVVLGVYGAHWQSAGTPSPSTFTLAPGASRKVTYAATTPAVPGDTSASLVFASSSGAPVATTTIPLVVRTQTTLTRAPQQFTDTVTGPNGRTYASSVGRFFDMQVAAGLPELNVDIREASAGNPFLALLVDPQGQAEAQTSSDLVDGNTLRNQSAGQLHVLNPQAGLWRLVITFGPVVKGNALTMRYTVEYDATPVPASAVGLPTSSSTTLARGKAVAVNVTLHNDGPSPEPLFLDPRRSGTSSYATAVSPSTVALPNVAGGVSIYTLPTRTSRMTDTVTSSVPVSFDVNANEGYPDYIGHAPGMTSTGTYQATPLSPGLWFLFPSEVGPYGTGAGPSATATVSASMTTQTFDGSVSTTTGDFWLSSIDPNAQVTPVIVPAGGSVTVPVTITPSAAKGTVVSGVIVVDQLVSTGTPFGLYEPDADELAALSYTYTVG